MSSSAIARYVDHLPPQMNVTPVFSSCPIAWWRETGAPGGAFGSRYSGRQPCHAESTSERRRRIAVERHEAASLTRYWISSSVTPGELVASHFLSVEPTIVCPSHGRKYMVAPLELRSSQKPMPWGVKYPGSTMCTPAAAATD